MSKYYKVHCYTAYEDKYCNISYEVAENYPFHNFVLLIEEDCDDMAEYFWDSYTVEEYDYNYQDYRADCGWDLIELTEEEYRRAMNDD